MKREVSGGDMSIQDFAAKQLKRCYRKVRKKGKALAGLDAPTRHKLRIKVKKMRCAAEFFGDLFAGTQKSRRRKRFVTSLKRLQDSLGDLNDITVDEALISKMGSRLHRSSQKRAIAAGLLTEREDAGAEAAMWAATKAYEELVGVRPFWR